ncbi:hypothetical protein LSAT2_027566 [Lamellibrachia satsuma]|nr:hypothetical protein LSAT2_027566 [Lamellibrachia satsuma]
MEVVTSSLLLVFSVFVNCPVMTSTPYIRCPLTCACDGTGAFRPLVKITELILSDNPLNSSALHEALFGLQGAPLRELVMSNLNLGELSATLFEGLGDTNITVVWLKSSHIASVKKGAFRNLQKLTSLHLGANQLALLQDRVFEDLLDLVYLNLENNHIVDLPSVKRVGLSPGLSVLVLDMNSIKHITYDSLKGYTNLTNLHLRHNNIYKISVDAFKSLFRLKTLDLRENRIRWLSHGTFDTLTRLEILLLAKNDITLETSSLFQPLVHLKALDLSENSFLGRRPDKLRTILQNLTNLESISLTGCEIATLSVGMFFNTTRLRTVSLSGNAIRSWNPAVFAPLRQLRLLTLARNKIVSVKIASFSGLTSLSELDLAHNPFACDCDLTWFLDYVHDNNIFVIHIGSPSLYTCASPASVQGVPILRAQLTTEDCISRTDLYITVATATAVAVTAIIFSLAYRGRWYIRYYFYLMRSRRRRYRELADGSSYVYDAFVAHNSDDRVWVVRSLLKRLELEGRYRLCLHQRDWLVGREISENIVESIEKSRKVIVVLSNSFAKSRWCQIELAMANNRCLGNRRKSLILVLLETISPENQTAAMRCLLTTQTYLEWNEREEERFWKALKKALRPPHGTTAVPMESFQQHGP